MYNNLTKFYKKIMWTIVSVVALLSIAGFCLSFAFKYNFSPTIHELIILATKRFDVVVIILLMMYFVKPYFYNGAIEEFVKATGLSMEEITKNIPSERKIYSVKKGNIRVKRKYSEPVIDEIERLLNKEEYKNVAIKHYKRTVE